jgi:hypothetical protein
MVLVCYNAVVSVARFVPRIPMVARPAVLPIPATPRRLRQVLSRQHTAPINPFRINTYRMAISVDSKEPTEHLSPVKSTLMKTQGEGVPRTIDAETGKRAGTAVPCPTTIASVATGSGHLDARSFSKSGSVRMGTPRSLALSYFEPGSVPTTT